VNIVNGGGSVTLHPSAGRQVTITAITYSDKVEVDFKNPDAKRVEARTHMLSAKSSNDECRVDYDVAVPAGVSVTVSTSTAPITIENLNGDFSVSSDTGQITVRNAANSFVHVHSLTAPISLSDLTGTHAEIMSSGGSVQMVNVTGPKVKVSTTSGDITYQGDCSGGGAYTLVTHSGAINVTLPETASVDLSAQSVSGSVVNDFPFQERSHNTFVPTPGRSFSGTSHSGSSSVELQSFSGKIRVKKQ
jgi:DUF4097 and DUF4098 domain-containing protein YvlB